MNATDHAVKQARKEADEVKRAITEELDTLKKEYEKVEETVTRQCKVVSEQDRNKLIARHKQELDKGSAGGGRSSQRKGRRCVCGWTRQERKSTRRTRSWRALKEAKGIPINTTATPPTSNRGPGREVREGAAVAVSQAAAFPRAAFRPRAEGVRNRRPKAAWYERWTWPTSPERKGPRQAFVEGGSSNVVVDMNNMAGQHASLDRACRRRWHLLCRCQTRQRPQPSINPNRRPEDRKKARRACPYAPTAPSSRQRLRLCSLRRPPAVHTAACCPRLTRPAQRVVKASSLFY